MIFKKPLLKREESVVEIELSTDIERKFLKVEETELVQFLRKELSNPTVTLRITIKEAELKQRLYTDKEKFNYLAEKQPLLLKLKEKLYLDTDF
jgi:single-stranded DNA-specific DHH superfamily exonuclease